MILIQQPIREQYFAGKNCCNIHQKYIALISLATTSFRSYSGVVVMSPVLQAKGTGFKSQLFQKNVSDQGRFYPSNKTTVKKCF